MFAISAAEPRSVLVVTVVAVTAADAKQPALFETEVRTEAEVRVEAVVTAEVVR